MPKNYAKEWKQKENILNLGAKLPRDEKQKDLNFKTQDKVSPRCLRMKKIEEKCFKTRSKVALRWKQKDKDFKT